MNGEINTDAQGSRTGKGLSSILRQLGIKEGKAYYWIAEYEVSNGDRSAKPKGTPSVCEECGEEYPSKTQLKKHVRDSHFEAHSIPVVKESQAATEFVTPAVEEYTPAELKRSADKEKNENELEPLFKTCGFNFYVKQNSSVNEERFNVVFSALSKKEVHTLSQYIKKGIKN